MFRLCYDVNTYSHTYYVNMCISQWCLKLISCFISDSNTFCSTLFCSNLCLCLLFCNQCTSILYLCLPNLLLCVHVCCFLCLFLCLLCVCLCVCVCFYVCVIVLSAQLTSEKDKLKEAQKVIRETEAKVGVSCAYVCPSPPCLHAWKWYCPGNLQINRQKVVFNRNG